MYEIKFLSSEDFDNLPVEVTKGSNISDSLGFYNPDLGKAYIRWTAYPELNKYLLDHEFEHMIEGDATDVDENGIRHKKFFKQLLAPFLTAGILPILSGLTQPKKKESPGTISESQQPLYNPMFQNQMASQPLSATPASSNKLPESTQNNLSSQYGSFDSIFGKNPQYQYGAPAGRLVF